MAKNKQMIEVPDPVHDDASESEEIQEEARQDAKMRSSTMNPPLQENLNEVNCGNCNMSWQDHRNKDVMKKRKKDAEK